MTNTTTVHISEHEINRFIEEQGKECNLDRKDPMWSDVFYAETTTGGSGDEKLYLHQKILAVITEQLCGTHFIDDSILRDRFRCEVKIIKKLLNESSGWIKAKIIKDVIEILTLETLDKHKLTKEVKTLLKEELKIKELLKDIEENHPELLI